MESKVILTEKDLSLVNDNVFNAKQMQVILARTPEEFIKERPAKGGGTWKYVSGAYVRKCLNLMFGFDWDFEILDELIIHGEAVVKGRLTCRCNGKIIAKTQFGNKEIVCKRGTDTPLSIGNDMKAAATDCLKKCAAELGIAGDIYNADDFQEVVIETIQPEDIQALFEEVKGEMTAEQVKATERILAKSEVHSYRRAFDFMTNLKGGLNG